MPANYPGRSRPRIALYGHDTQGLGHLRRNLHLAAGFAEDGPGQPGADVLILSGTSKIGLFDRPHGVEAIVVPGIGKDATGGYRPRQLRGHGLAEVIGLRSSTIAGALNHFDPGLLVVDKTPLGFSGELARVLPSLADRGTRLVLGLRDVLDAPAAAARQWRSEHGDAAVQDLYDEVWVYGDREVHDLPAAIGMAAEARSRVHYVGYVAGRQPGGAGPARRPPLPAGSPGYVLVMVGGGQDGIDLARAAVRMPLPGSLTLVLLTGPQMPAAAAAGIAAQARPGQIVLPFTPHASAWLAGAQAAITMGGANTITEILASSTPALVVPRVRPRQEQAVRAAALSSRGLIDLMWPDELDAAALGRWAAAAAGHPVNRSHVNLGGVNGARFRARSLLSRGPAAPLSRPGHPARHAGAPARWRSHAALTR